MKPIINKNYTKLITSVFVTRFGDAIDSIAFSWMVFIMTGSRVLMGSIFAISILPNIICLPFAGVLADHYNKKTLTVIGDFLRGCSVAILALFYYFNILEVWHLFVFVSINSLFESFANPARNSMLQSLVDSEHYMKGASWLGTSSQFGSLIGMSVATILIGVVGIWGTILIDAFTFFFSGVLNSTISFQDKREQVENKPKFTTYLHHIKEGAKYMMGKKMLVTVMLIIAFINFSFVPYNVLRPVYVTEILSLGVEGLSYMGTSLLLGMVVGGYLMGLKGKNANPIKAIGLGLTLVGIMYMSHGIPEYVHLTNTQSIIFTIVVCFFLGAFIPVVNAPLDVVIMKTTAPEMIGRLTSIISLMALCAMPLGGVFVSLIGDQLSVSIVYALMGFLGVLLSITFIIKNRGKELV